VSEYENSGAILKGCGG